MIIHIQDKEKTMDAFRYIWNELDKTWDGDERPENWDETCEHMRVIMEGVGIEYNKYGDLK